MNASPVLPLFLAAFILCACMPVPGETLTSSGLQRDIKTRVLMLASTARPQCRSNSIVNTEVVELHPDGKVAVERWTVDRCGERVHYVVNLPATGRGSNFLVREDR